VEAARAAEGEFDRVFVKKEAPSQVEERRLPAQDEAYWMVALLHDLGLAASRGEARRLLQQGGVSVDGTRVDGLDHELTATAGCRYRLKVGKRHFLDLVFD